MSIPYLTASHARKLVAQITRDNHAICPALFELIAGLSDPDGNALFQALQDQVARDVFVMLPEFEAAYEAAHDKLAA